MEKKEAEQALDKERSNIAEKFCPVIGRTCIPTCMCFYEGRVADNGVRETDGDWRAYPPYCTHVLVNGTIVVET